jgi:hypothetical protein
MAGTVPLVALLLLARFDPECAGAGVVSYCTGFSIFVGAAAGAMVAWRERVQASRAGNWLLAAGIALLTAGLGCARLGLASVAGVALGMAVGRMSLRTTEAPGR